MNATPEVEPFGDLPDGRSVERGTLRNACGHLVRFITCGGAITDIHVPGRVGHVANIVPAHPDLACYVGQTA